MRLRSWSSRVPRSWLPTRWLELGLPSGAPTGEVSRVQSGFEGDSTVQGGQVARLTAATAGLPNAAIIDTGESHDICVLIVLCIALKSIAPCRSECRMGGIFNITCDGYG